MGWMLFQTLVTGLGAETRWQQSRADNNSAASVTSVEEGFRQLDAWFGDTGIGGQDGS